ncbi:MAG: hypothetical protein IPQ02_08320 [Saprospiraceae bacterium]|nr:hypothetical protein [Candidatus Defluviibacterium haderslevense]
MKLNIFLLTMLPLFTINSQIVEFIGSSGGPLGEQKRDTVTFGFAHNCTVGLDQLYNEIDITNKPNDSMDLRIFQRNILNYNCLIDTSLNEIVFENSYQLKKDFRSINPKPKECYFEIENITDNFKGGYLINLKNYHSIQNKSTYIGVSAISECGDRNDYHNALNNTDSIYIWSQILPQKKYIKERFKEL